MCIGCQLEGSHLVYIGSQNGDTCSCDEPFEITIKVATLDNAYEILCFPEAHVIPLVTLARKVHKVVEEGF